MKTKLISLILAAVFLLTACGTSQPTTAAPDPADPPKAESMPEIKIDAADFSYASPESVSAGWVRVILTNSGKEPHHVQFLRLNDGVTVDQFETTLKQGEGPAMAMTKQVGGVGAIHPGGTAKSVIDLPAGDYIILCLIPSPSDNTAHHAKGMIKSLKVEAGSSSASEPSAGLTVRLKDFTFDLPESLPVGSLTVKVVNDGPEPHEFNILRLEEGKTLNDVMEFFKGAGGPPPFAPVGGMNGLDAGATGYAELNLEPGIYVAICNIPSPNAQGAPHFMMGMVKQFTAGDTAPQSNFPSGKFESANEPGTGLVFNSDGTFSVYIEDNVTVVSGTYTTEGNVYTETSNDGGCVSPMSFNFKFDGTKLTFTYVGDPDDDKECSGRNADFNNQTYTLVQ